MSGRNTENSKARPFENHEESATRKFNVKSFATGPETLSPQNLQRKGGPPAYIATKVAVQHPFWGDVS
jgi:hypothetical protein